MGSLVTGSAFLGAILGRSFKVLALVPAGLLGVAILLLRPELAGRTTAGFSLAFAAMVTSLELGYVAGLMSTDALAVARALYRLFARSRHAA
jgi:hypothetical protein